LRAFLLLHARLRVHWASGIPCALFYWSGEKFPQTSGGSRREIVGGCLNAVIASQNWLFEN
jgi:hypothetical protein